MNYFYQYNLYIIIIFYVLDKHFCNSTMRYYLLFETYTLIDSKIKSEILITFSK